MSAHADTLALILAEHRRRQDAERLHAHDATPNTLGVCTRCGLTTWQHGSKVTER